MPKGGSTRDLELDLAKAVLNLQRLETEHNRRAENRLLQAHSRHLLTLQCMISGYILVPTQTAFSVRENTEKKASTELMHMGLEPALAISTSVEDIPDGSLTGAGA